MNILWKKNNYLNERIVRIMKVILKADIKGVGKKDEIINASDGYVRNYLFPKNLAVEANSENMAKLQAQNDSKKFKKDTEREEAKQLAEKMNKIMLKIKVKAGENGKIFGGVSAKDIAEAFEIVCTDEVIGRLLHFGLIQREGDVACGQALQRIRE